MPLGEYESWVIVVSQLKNYTSTNMIGLHVFIHRCMTIAEDTYV